MIGRGSAAPLVLLALLGCCAPHDPRRYLDTELAFLQAGVEPEQEEREVRRVLAQRDLRVVARVASESFVALGAARRDGSKSAVRVITSRGVAHAEDASRDDLFLPGTVALLEHFGGPFGDYVLVASARIAPGRETGCVTLWRVLRDGHVVACKLDVSVFGTHACVSNVAQGGRGRLRATIAWPALHAVTTPTLEAELTFADPPSGKPAPLSPLLSVPTFGDWIERERARLATVRLARSSFSVRHATGVARAALGALTGRSSGEQVDIYRAAIQSVLPGSPEAEVAATTLEHIQAGWFDREAAAAAAARESAPADEPRDPPAAEPSLPEDATVIEPEPIEPE